MYLPVSVMDANHLPRTPEGRVPGGKELILVDVVMPVMSGPKAVEAIQARGPHPPVILASGYADQALASHSLHGIPLVERPFEPDALLRIIRRKLDEAG